MEEHFQHKGQHHHHHKHVEKEAADTQKASNGNKAEDHADHRDKKEKERERKERARQRQREAAAAKATAKPAAAAAATDTGASPAASEEVVGSTKLTQEELKAKLNAVLKIKHGEKPLCDPKFAGVYTFTYTAEDQGPTIAELRLQADGTCDLELVIEHASLDEEEIKDIQDYFGFWGSECCGFVIALQGADTVHEFERVTFGNEILLTLKSERVGPFSGLDKQVESRFDASS